MFRFNFKNAQFAYEPYPVCYIPMFFSEAEYKALSDSYPDLSLFKFKERLGNKYSLAEKNNGEFYKKFLRENKVWGDFYERIKTKEFVNEVVEFMKANHVEVEIKKNRYWLTKNMRRKRRGVIARLVNKKQVRSRFEFSVMTASGGNILPHTDDPRKNITLVLSFIKENEWQDEWGGGTNVCIPKDRSKIYNFVNNNMPFEKVENIKTFPFKPNQALIFVKTFNSWHSVDPMSGPESALRKTVTINIETMP